MIFAQISFLLDEAIGRDKSETLERAEWDKTRPDTRPIPVAVGWAGPKCVFSHFKLDHHGPTDQRTNGPTDGWTNQRPDGQTDRRTDKASYRVACSQLKTDKPNKTSHQLVLMIENKAVYTI